MVEEQHVVVGGTDLPLRMPISRYSDLPELPRRLLENCGEKGPSLLEQYAVPVIVEGRDLVILGTAPRGADQVTPLVVGTLTRMLVQQPPPPHGRRPAESKHSRTCNPSALLLAPTRALVTYASHAARDLAEGTGLRCADACGGVSIDASATQCVEGVDLLVASPGRLLDLLDRGCVGLSAVRFLVLIGADALLDLGFDAHLRRIVLDEGLPSTMTRQTILSCVALTEPLQRISAHLYRQKAAVTLTNPKPWLAQCVRPLVKQTVVFADERGMQPALCALLTSAGDRAQPGGTPANGEVPCLSLVVVSTRRHCEILLYFLQGEGFAVGALMSDRPKKVEKDSLLSKFTSGALRVLVVTDAALSALSDELCPVGHVISFDFPASMTEYAQRLSHTGRGGRTGRKTTMVTDAAPRAQVEALVHLLQSTGSEVPRWLEWMARVNPSQLSGGA